MKLLVKVKANARKNEVLELSKDEYRVSVTAPPVDGKANAKVIELLAEFFHKPKSAFSIITGQNTKIKRIEML